MHGRIRILPFFILGFIFLLALYAYNGFEAVVSSYSSPLQNSIYGIFYGLGVLSLLTLIIVFYGGNTLSKALRNFFFAFVFIHLFSLLIFDLFVLMDDLRRLGYLVFQSDDLSRSYGLITLGLCVTVLPAFLFILGMIMGPHRYKIHEITIGLDQLPQAFDNLKIVQISDIHSGSFYNKKGVEKGVKLVMDQQPDLVFFTGDLVNDDAAEINPFKSIFSKITAPFGVYSILGNHDYGDYVQWPTKEAKAQNLEDLKAAHGEMGWRLLLDEHIYLEKDTEKIAVIGVQNWGKGFHQVGDLAVAYEGCEAPVKLLLSHDPTHWDEQVTQDYKDIDITFSGHTHGAQMGFEIGRFKWSPIQLRYKKWAGLYQNGKQFLYINRGFGFLGYPGRLGIWPEITVITLSKGK